MKSLPKLRFLIVTRHWDFYIILRSMSGQKHRCGDRPGARTSGGTSVPLPASRLPRVRPPRWTCVPSQ
jgi:hypothetical protein